MRGVGHSVGIDGGQAVASTVRPAEREALLVCMLAPLGEWAEQRLDVSRAETLEGLVAEVEGISGELAARSPLELLRTALGVHRGTHLVRLPPERGGLPGSIPVERRQGLQAGALMGLVDRLPEGSWYRGLARHSGRSARQLRERGFREGPLEVYVSARLEALDTARPSRVGDDGLRAAVRREGRRQLDRLVVEQEAGMQASRLLEQSHCELVSKLEPEVLGALGRALELRGERVTSTRRLVDLVVEVVEAMGERREQDPAREGTQTPTVEATLRLLEQQLDRCRSRAAKLEGDIEAIRGLRAREPVRVERRCCDPAALIEEHDVEALACGGRVPKGGGLGLILLVPPACQACPTVRHFRHGCFPKLSRANPPVGRAQTEPGLPGRKARDGPG